jgi:hypothetical protein
LAVAIVLDGAAARAAPTAAARTAAAPTARCGGSSSLTEALGALTREGYGAAARHISRRVRQRRPKMKLGRAEACAAVTALRRLAAASPTMRALHDVMPRSLIELARAVAERGVGRREAKAMAAYLVGLVQTLRPGNLAQLDENHSHVIGRDWPEIDYGGEGTSWRARRAYWRRYGVKDFKRAEHLQRYFLHAQILPYFRRIYRPAGRISAAAPLLPRGDR